MSASARPQESVNPKSGMTQTEVKEFVRNHFEVVRNRWTGTEAATGKKFEFSGIVIWRIAKRQLVERWAYLTPPQPAKS